jgi:hypothetical protein
MQLSREAEALLSAVAAAQEPEGSALRLADLRDMAEYVGMATGSTEPAVA